MLPFHYKIKGQIFSESLDMAQYAVELFEAVVS